VRWGKYGVQNNFSSIRIDLKLPFRINIYFVFLFIATAMLFTSPFVINDAFAIKVTIINDAFDNNSPNELKWQMVFISSTPACSNYHYQMMYTYYDVALQYLKLYELENISYDPLCITEKKYLSNYDNPSDLDLLILVYDKDLGEKELHANQMGGVYTHSGMDKTQNHVIIICDCSNFYYSSPAWILSHEISHFILYYEDFEMTVIERLIHVNDAKYDLCLKESTTCKSSSIKMIAGPGGYGYSVMPIYQPAVGLQTENEVINDDAKYLDTSQLTKIITHWWATDIISDEQYSNAIRYLVDSNVISSGYDAELILTDEPLDNVVTWEQMMEEITPTYWDHEPKSDDDSMAYLSKIPSNMISNDKNLLSVEKNFGLPEWFKETALWWGQDMITDKEFNKNLEYLVKEGIIESHTSSVFQELVVESESLTASPSIPSPSNEQNSDESLSQNLVVESESLTASPSIPSPSNEQNSDESLSQNLVVESESLPASLSIESPSNEQKSHESLSHVHVSEEPSDISIEIVTEKEKDIPVEIEGIHVLVEFVNSIPDIDNRVMKNLEPAVIAFDDGNINAGCNNLENFIIILEYLIDSNKIDQSLGQSLIAEGEIIKLELCN